MRDRERSLAGQYLRDNALFPDLGELVLLEPMLVHEKAKHLVCRYMGPFISHPSNG